MSGAKAIPERLYRLRWRFEFSDGRPPKYGQWSNPGNIETDGAWRVNKSNLSRAAVEAECLRTFNITTLAECDGWDFVNFEWQAVASMPGFLGVEAISPRGEIVGLTLVTRELQLVCFINGDQAVKARTEADKKIHLAGFGR